MDKTKIKSFKELFVWQKSMDLAKEVYEVTRDLPKEELYGLIFQMRRSAVSIPSNIAEGSRRKDFPEYSHFLRIADGSAAELETQILLAQKLYPNLEWGKSSALLLEIQKMLWAVNRKLEVAYKLRVSNKIF